MIGEMWGRGMGIEDGTVDAGEDKNGGIVRCETIMKSMLSIVTL